MKLVVILGSLVCWIYDKSSAAAFVTRVGGSERKRTVVMATSTAPPKLKVLTGVRDIHEQYDVFLLDMWGVMHDGTTTYPGVLETVQELRKRGKELIILSNSSKRRTNSIKMLTKLGFDPLNDFSQIITSGEVAYQLLSQASPQDGDNDGASLFPKPWNVLSEVWERKIRKVFCFGSGDGDEEYLQSCGWVLSSVEEADVIVARGTFTILDGSTSTDKTIDGEEAYFEVYRDQLQKAAERNIPMIVANPDKVRPDKDRSPMPGTIGCAYEQALATAACPDPSNLIKYLGKPFDDVYEIALRGKDPSRVCMIGDALETDVTGGESFGIDTIWIINDGVHNTEVADKGQGDMQVGCSRLLEEFNQQPETYAKGRQLHPSVVLPHFKW